MYALRMFTFHTQIDVLLIALNDMSLGLCHHLISSSHCGQLNFVFRVSSFKLNPSQVYAIIQFINLPQAEFGILPPLYWYANLLWAQPWPLDTGHYPPSVISPWTAEDTNSWFPQSQNVWLTFQKALGCSCAVHGFSTPLKECEFYSLKKDQHCHERLHRSRV